MKMAAVGLKKKHHPRDGRQVSADCSSRTPTWSRRFRWSHIGIISKQGQICTATSRILVHESQSLIRFVSQFCQQIKGCIRHWRPNSGARAHSKDIPGHQAAVRKKKVLSYVDIGKAEGAQLIVGGEAYSNSNSNSGSGSGTANGYYFGQATPSSPTSRLACASTAQEIFGPFCRHGYLLERRGRPWT